MDYTPLTMLVYGDSGSGKSTLACSAPGPRLIIDAESAGHFAHRRINGEVEQADITRWIPGEPLPTDIKDVCVITIDSWREVGPIEEVLRSGDHPFRSVIVDSVTELQQRLFTSIGSEKNRETMQRDDWGLARARFGNFLRSIRDMAAKDIRNPVVCTVFVALPKENDNTGKTVPYLQGSVRDDLPGLVDIVAYVAMDRDVEEEKDFQLMARSSTVTQNKIAKTRPPYFEGLWPNLITDPNLEEIWESIQPSE